MRIDIENINTFQGCIPSGCDLVVYEKGTDPQDGFVLYGFDEVGELEDIFDIKKPKYCFLSTTTEEGKQ